MLETYSWLPIFIAIATILETSSFQQLRVRRSSEDPELSNYQFPESCYGTTGEDSGDRRKRRSTEVSIKNSTDETIWSEEFIECEHFRIDEGCYLVLKNNSVYTHGILVNTTNYLVLDGALYICATTVLSAFQQYRVERSLEEQDFSKHQFPNRCYGTTGDASRERKKRRATEEESSESSTNQTNRKYSDGFYECGHIPIDDGCYLILKNNSVYTHGILLNTTDYVITNGTLYMCATNLPRPPEVTSVLSTITEIGLGVSCVCLVLYAAIFFFVPSIRNLPGYCLFSLCISLLVSYICIFARYALETDQDCSDIGMLMLYFFLSSFFWMNVLSYDVWRSLRMATCKLRLTTHVWLRFAMYSLYAWGSALFVIVIAIVIDSLGDVDIQYKLSFRQDSCWIEHRKALFLYFAVPLTCMMGLNIIFFIWSFFMITSAMMNNAENRTVLWSRLCMFFRLFIIMGLTWIFGLIAAATNVEVFWYFFVIFNTSQGVFIFCNVFFSEKVKKVWGPVLGYRLRKVSCTATVTSFQSQQPGTTV